MICKYNNSLEGQAYIHEEQGNTEQAFELYMTVFKETMLKAIDKAKRDLYFSKKKNESGRIINN